MHRRTVALLLVLASTAVACDRGYEEETESGGVSQSIFSTITGPPFDRPRPPFVPGPPPAPTGGFGPVQVSPHREQRAVLSSSAGPGGGGAENCWESPVLTEYTLAKSGGKPTWVAAATDGSVWFSDPATTSVARLEPSGAVTRYPLPEGRTPGSLVVARDGSVWVATVGPAIAHLTKSGRLVGYAVPTTQGNPMGGVPDTAPAALTAGPDGAIWFLEMGADKVGRITADGKITEYPLPERERMHANPEGMAVGSDGAIWFSETLKMRMGRIDPKTFAITEFVIPPVPAGVPPATVTAGPDGAIWFDGSALGRMTTTGEFKAFPLPWQGQYAPNSITAGPDGRLWVIDSRNGKVLRMTTQGEVAELPAVADPKGLYAAGLEQMDGGPDAVWFAQPELNRIGRFACRKPASSDAV
jgi:virginiamycin B lyase